MSSSEPPRVDPAVAAHLRDRINNPLAAIDVEAQLLLMNEDVQRLPEVRESAERILAQCRRIAAFLRDLRDDRPPPPR